MRSNRENSSEARYMITRQKRPLNLRYNRGAKPTQVNASIELVIITFQHHCISGGWLTKVDLLK